MNVRCEPNADLDAQTEEDDGNDMASSRGTDVGLEASRQLPQLPLPSSAVRKRSVCPASTQLRPAPMLVRFVTDELTSCGNKGQTRERIGAKVTRPDGFVQPRSCKAEVREVW